MKTFTGNLFEELGRAHLIKGDTAKFVRDMVAFASIYTVGKLVESYLSPFGCDDGDLCRLNPFYLASSPFEPGQEKDLLLLLTFV